MLGRRRRRRANIEPTLVQCFVFAGKSLPVGDVFSGIITCAALPRRLPGLRNAEVILR